MAFQCASVSGSLVGRLAFIGKSVRGRLTVSFHSGMGIHRFYNVWMRRTTLGNGLKVLIQEEHTAPLASVWCWYKVGSKDERPGLTGVSHWCEHMNFKGTENSPRDQMKGIIEQYGGRFSGRLKFMCSHQGRKSTRLNSSHEERSYGGLCRSTKR